MTTSGTAHLASRLGDPAPFVPARPRRIDGVTIVLAAGAAACLGFSGLAAFALAVVL